MQILQQQTKIVKALIYAPQKNGGRLLVDVRNVTDYTWERMARFARDMDCCGRDYEIQIN